MPIILYVLKLANSKWFVGTTSQQLDKLLEEHCRGNVSTWTKMYPPLGITLQREVLTSQNRFLVEIEEMYRLMMIHGLDNVRGEFQNQTENFRLEQADGLIRQISETLRLDVQLVRQRVGLRSPTPPSYAASGCQTATPQSRKRIIDNRGPNQNNANKSVKISSLAADFSSKARMSDDETNDYRFTTAVEECSNHNEDLDNLSVVCSVDYDADTCLFSEEEEALISLNS
jgi:hypothetical protein